MLANNVWHTEIVSEKEFSYRDILVFTHKSKYKFKPEHNIIMCQTIESSIVLKELDESG